MISKTSSFEAFTNDRNPSQRLTVAYKNFGDPYAEGATFCLEDASDGVLSSVDLEMSELRLIHRLLGNIISGVVK